jgi:predicted enzyme related to lactoylglutathione lyase
VQPAEDTPYGRMASLTDPTGAIFKLIENQAA